MEHYTSARPVLARLHVEHSAGYLPLGKCKYAVMFLKSIVRQCVQWLNNTVNLHHEARDNITGIMFYRFHAVLFYCHASGLSMKKGISTLLRFGKTTPSLITMRYILTNFIAFIPTVYRQYTDNVSTWHDQRDMTPHLDVFELLCFNLVSSVFVVPLHERITLDDDLVGKRIRDNQLKSLSERKSDKKVKSRTWWRQVW